MLVDLIACLDILFTEDSESDKKALVQERMEYFIGQNQQLDSILRKDLGNNIILAYLVRNAVIHSGKWLNKDTMMNYKTKSNYCVDDPWKFLLRLREYARRTICCYIKDLSSNNKYKTAIRKRRDIIQRSEKHSAIQQRTTRC